MKRSTVVVVVLVSAVGAILGYEGMVTANTVPLKQQVVQAGYPATELAIVACANWDGEYACSDKNAKPKDITELHYRPAGAPEECVYRFTRVDAGMLSKSTWEFRFVVDKVDGAIPSLGNSSDHIGPAGDGWSKDSEGRLAVASTAPTPAQLWKFVTEHLASPNEKCNPTIPR